MLVFFENENYLDQMGGFFDMWPQSFQKVHLGPVSLNAYIYIYFGIFVSTYKFRN